MQPSAGCLGRPDAHPTLVADRVSCLAKFAAIRSFEIDFEPTVQFYDTDLSSRLAGVIDARCA
jgi:hypothetical protein